MKKQYQPDGSFVYIKEEKDIENCPKYLKPKIEMTSNLYMGLPKFEGATNCKNEQECEIISKLYSEKINLFNKFKTYLLTFILKLKIKN